MNSTIQKILSPLLLTSLISGCAVPTLTNDQLKARASTKTSEAIQEFVNQPRPQARVKEVSSPLIDFKKTEVSKIRGDINVKAASAPFAPVLNEIASKEGYSVAYSEQVQVSRKVTVDFNNSSAEEAIRTTAFLAGYIAIIDKHNKTIYVSDSGTYTFKLPAGVFSLLQAQYAVGGNPAASASGGSGGGAGSAGGGGGGGGTSLKAEFNVVGREGTSTGGLTAFLQSMAGKSAEVIVTETGHVSVHANAQALRRVHEFMKGFVKEAMTQVEIEASVVEVSLVKDFALGIQWGSVINNASQGFMTGGAAGGAISGALTGAGPGGLVNQVISSSASNGLSSFKVGVSSASLINALAQFTDVNVVSQPRLVSMNNVPATFFDGTQVPYLGSVQQTPTTVNGASPTVTGSVAFAIDGISFSAIPSVVDGNTVQISLIPVLSTVNGFSNFLNNTLTAPNQTNKQTYMRVLAESGKTLILGGIRYNKDSKNTSLPSSVSATSNAKEVVILMRANVIPAPNFDPIFSESL